MTFYPFIATLGAEKRNVVVVSVLRNFTVNVTASSLDTGDLSLSILSLNSP